MPTYCFRCESPDHPEGESRDFIRVIQHMPKKVVNQSKCDCGAVARRDLASEIQSQSVIGATPISHSTTGRGSAAREIEFAVGKFKTNPDGSVDMNHRPFRDTGEMSKFMNGQNELGEPVVKDDGNVLRRKDGSVVRKGAKLFRYGPNAAPRHSGLRRRESPVPSAWVDQADSRLQSARGGIPLAAPVHRSPERKAR